LYNLEEKKEVLKLSLDNLPPNDIVLNIVSNDQNELGAVMWMYGKCVYFFDENMNYKELKIEGSVGTPVAAKFYYDSEKDKNYYCMIPKKGQLTMID